MSDGHAGQIRKSSSSFHFLAGLSSGVTTAFLLQPADLLKTRVQQSRGSTLSSALRSILDGPSPLRNLWRGTTPSVIRTGVGSALYFGMLNQLRLYASAASSSSSSATIIPAAAANPSGNNDTSKPKLSNAANLLTGALARATAGFTMSPVTVLKVRYESSHYAYTSLLSAARDIARTDGIRGFFAGFGATAVRDAPYAGLYLLFYEQSKGRLNSLVSAAAGDKIVIDGAGVGVGAAAGRGGGAQKQSVTVGAAISFTSGFLAAVTATALTNPFDAIKTRLQLYPARYRNMGVAARRMVQEEGVRSLFHGLGLRMGRKAVSSALAWTVYEELIRRAETRLV